MRTTMTILRGILATQLALVTLWITMIFIGPLVAIIYGSAIASVVLIVIVANRRTSTSVERAPYATERAVLGTLWAGIAVWKVMGSGQQDFDRSLLAMTFTVITIATALILNVSLKAAGERQ